MMKTITIVLFSLVVFAGAALAQDVQAAPAPAGTQDELTASTAEDNAFLEGIEQMSATQIGALTVADITRIGARLSLAQQRLAYVRRASMASLVFPGAGQFMTGNTLEGALFLTGDLAVVTGTILGAYFLLPGDLRFDGLDYYTASFGSIETAWKSHSIQDYLPSAGVMAGGMLVKVILGHVSSRLAAQEARQNIADGKVKFSPRFELMGNGFMMGMRMRM